MTPSADASAPVLAVGGVDAAAEPASNKPACTVALMPLFSVRIPNN
jgi:hypothetical protein